MSLQAATALPSGTGENQTPERSSPDSSPGSPKPAGERLISLDAFRGAVLLLMASSGFGIPEVARSFRESRVWEILGYECDHTIWVGCTLWDLIQPAFMFMVGVALPWSLANRRARGQRTGSMFGHALWRALALILLAVFLTSAWSRRTEWVFTNVLAQIGLGYPFLFLLAFTRSRTLAITAACILFGYWLAFAFCPVPAAGFDWKAVGVPENWPHLTGFAAHWDKNSNLAAQFDVWFLNLFPRETAFAFTQGGYSTLNFVPSLATMIFGLLTGRLLRSDLSIKAKLKYMVIAGLGGVLAGEAGAFLGLCPIVKRIWTPSWALYSGGWVVLLLAGFVVLIEYRGWRSWTFPLVVAGTNPITLYCMWQLMGKFIRENLERHLGRGIYEFLGISYRPILEHAWILLVFWLILWWMYRRRIFLRL